MMADPAKKSRKPYPRVRKPRKTVFTPTIWMRWMLGECRLCQPADERTLHLRAGIAEFRNRLQATSDPGERAGQEYAT